MDQELVTRFTADISEYKKSITTLQGELKQLSGVTGQVRAATAQAMNSAYEDTRKLGKQVESLVKTQERNVQAATASSVKITDYSNKVEQLQGKLKSQNKEYASLAGQLTAVTSKYREQQAFLNDYKDGIAGVNKQHEELAGLIRTTSRISTRYMTLEEIEQHRAGLQRMKNDLEVFNDELRDVGLNPDNLKTDTLDKLKAEIQSVSAQMNQQKNAMAQTTAQINKANGSLAIETTRYKSLRSTIKQNGEALTEMGNKLDNALQEEAFPPVESRMTKFKNKVKSLGSAFATVGSKTGAVFGAIGRATGSVFGKIGSAAGAAFGKVHSHLKNMRVSSGTASKSLLNVVKSIRRIGVVSLGLKVCKNIFGELRSVITGYLSQNEALNNRVEALKNAFAKALAPAINVVVGLFEKLMPYAMSVANAISGLLSSVGIASQVNATATAVGKTTKETKKLSQAQKELYGFDQITKVSDDQQDSSSSGASTANTPAASDQFSAYLEKIKNLWKSGDFEGIGEQVAASCNKVIDKIKNLDWDGIRKKVNDAVSGIANSLNGFVQDFDWAGVGEIVGQGVNTIFSALDTFLTTFKFDQLGAGLASNINGLVSTIEWGQVAKTISDAISGVFKAISGFLENLDWRGLATALENFIAGIDFGGMASSLFEALGAALGGISAFLGKLIMDAISSVQTYFGGKIKDAGGNVAQGIWDGIIDGIGDAWKWVKEHIFQPFINGFQKAFEIKSPSKVMKKQGGFISQGLFDGIGNLWKKVSKKFSEFKENLVNFFTGKNGIVTKVKGLGGKIVDGLKNGMKNLKKTFTNAFKGPLNGAIGLINNMIDKINDKLNISVGSTLSNVLSALGVSVTNGQYQLFSIPTIPELEKGGVLKKGQVGLLEGKGAEAVVPLERNTQWISKVAAMMVQMLGTSGQAVNVTIPIYVGGKHLSTVVLDDVNQTEKKGRDPVTATA